MMNKAEQRKMEIRDREGSAMKGPFDRHRVRANRNRAAAGFSSHRFLHDLAFDRVTDRLRDIRRNFPCAVFFGAAPGHDCREALIRAGGIRDLVQVDLAERRLEIAQGPCVQGDVETLCFGEGTLDLVLSILDLHVVNDLPGALIQIRRALKPDGLFIAALWGGETLSGLRRGMMESEIRLRGGAGPRVGPSIACPTLAGLMQRAGFALPVVDSEKITVTYADSRRLFADMKGMGESSALVDRPRSVPPRQMFEDAAESLREGSLLFARIEMIFAIGWAPHHSQPKPLEPGSASIQLADVL